MMRSWVACLIITLMPFMTAGCSGKKCTKDRDCAKTEYCAETGHCREAPPVRPGTAKVVKNTEPTEADREAAYKARLKAKENQPEPELDPKSPREQLLWVHKAGDKELDAIDIERQDIIAKIRDYKATVPAHVTVIRNAIKKLRGFSIGLKPAQLEDAPKRLCEVIESIRKPVEAMNDSVRKTLRALNVEWEKYNTIEEGWKAKEKELGKLSRKQQKVRVKNNRQMLKIQEQRDKIMPSINAGNAILLGLRSLLREAMVLAEHGARRTQLALGKCLSKINKNYISLDLVQNVMNKVIRRCKYYRE